jgi:hypothetical protein
MRTTLRSWLGEPIVQFVILGAIVFGLASFLSNDLVDQDDQVIITEQDIAHLASLWETQYAKPPTEKELASIIDQHVKEEILFREATKMGLAQDDVIVKRRLVQKFLFLSEQLTSATAPTEEELIPYFAETRDRYGVPSTTSFAHVYFKTDRDGEPAIEGAKSVMLRLNNIGTDEQAWRREGDPFMLAREFAARNDAEITQLFGDPFTQALRGLTTGAWTGPIESPFGWHVIKIIRRAEAYSPKLSDVRAQVAEDFVAAKRRQTEAALYDSIRRHYSVSIVGRPG